MKPGTSEGSSKDGSSEETLFSVASVLEFARARRGDCQNLIVYAALKETGMLDAYMEKQTAGARAKREVGTAYAGSSGFDMGSPEGDRTVLTVAVTTEEFAAMQRAILPPGDPEGIESLRKFEAVKNAVLAAGPRCEIRILVRKPKASDG